MIVYENSLKKFRDEVINNLITKKILNNFHKLGINMKNKISEINSWNNSIQFMNNVLMDDNFSSSVHIAIEYSIPSSSKRIDFMLFGLDQFDRKNYVIVELKQWLKAVDSGKNETVITFLSKKNRETLHPSYQGKEYLYLLENFNEYINNSNIEGKAFAYLHNAAKKDNLNLLNEQIYHSIIECPIFFKEDAKKLREKLLRLVGKGNGKEILFNIENSKIVPSKRLVDSISNLFKNREEFMLIDSQKIVYENIIQKINSKNNVFIINGNPGTGKSIVALNLFKKFIEAKKITNFITPNASFRECLIHGLSNKKVKDVSYKNLFKGSTSYYGMNENDFDWLIVDEAHRLKNAQYMYKGKNQIEDIIKSTKNVVFFVDENQMIRKNDIGSNKNIEEIAMALNKKIWNGLDFRLTTQFRCSGADGYINALDNALQIKETANFYLDDNEKYEFKIVDNPWELNKIIQEKIDLGFKKSKIVAGYAWKWNTKNLEHNQLFEEENYDIYIPEFDYKAVWNYKNNNKWAVSETSLKEVGCVHTCQGLEFDYCGVIIGNDIKIDSNNNLFASIKDYFDIEGKKGLKDNNHVLTKYIKNVYKILMSRGQMGTFVYICDEELRNYFKKFLKKNQYKYNLLG